MMILFEKLRGMVLKFTWLGYMGYVSRKITSCRRGAQDASSRGEESFWGIRGRINIGRLLSSRTWAIHLLCSRRQDEQTSMGVSPEMG